MQRRADGLANLPRVWWGIEPPGFREAAAAHERYSALPVLPAALDDDLQWLLAESPVPGSLGDEDEELPARPADVRSGAAVCAESFTDFLYRFRLENEIWRALALEHVPPASLAEAGAATSSSSPAE